MNSSSCSCSSSVLALGLKSMQPLSTRSEHDIGMYARPMADKPHYLGVAAIYRWEAENLREWVAFHRVVGVDRFFLYDNASEDDHLEALAPFVEDGSVTVHPWPVFPGQGSAYDHALARHGGEVRWIAFLDVDEFFFSPTGRPL